MESKRLIEEKMLIAGSGGQGLMFLGKTICAAAVKRNKNATFIPSYGAEMRGGTAHCFVRISDKEIPSPIFDKFTILFAFNKQSWEKFKNKTEPRAFIIVNSSLVDVKKNSSLRIASIPLSDLAHRAGSLKVINMIALGVFLKNTDIIDKNTIAKIIKEKFKDKKEILKQNLKALEVGLSYG